MKDRSSIRCCRSAACARQQNCRRVSGPKACRLPPAGQPRARHRRLRGADRYGPRRSFVRRVSLVGRGLSRPSQRDLSAAPMRTTARRPTSSSATLAASSRRQHGLGDTQQRAAFAVSCFDDVPSRGPRWRPCHCATSG
jgi:hypothetical protein